MPAEAPEPEVDDFSWLTGDTVPAPSPAAEGKPTASPAYAETVSIRRESEEADPLDLPLAATPSAEEPADAEASAKVPAADVEEFSWLEDVQQPPPDLAAVEATPPVETPPQTAPRFDSSKTIGDVGRTVEMFKEPDAEDASPAEDAGPDVSDDVPDFSSMALSPPAKDESAAGSVAISASSAKPTQPAAKEKSKSWWSFGGKKKDEAKSKAPEQPAEPAPAASEAEPEPAAAEPAKAAPAPAPAAAPAFVMPDLEEAASEQVAAESTEDDDALGQFFKSLK
jgi:hypothetical protein